MQELAKIEELSAASAPAIFENKDGVRQIIDRLREEVKSVVPDVTTAKGRKEIASLAHKVARSKTTLDGLGKELVAGIKEKAKVIDASRKLARDELDALKAEVRKPLDDWEAAEAARVKKHEDAIAVIKEYMNPCHSEMSSDLINSYWHDLESLEPDDSFEEFFAEAESAYKSAISYLKQCHQNAARREADQAELESLRKEAAEREEAERKAKAEQEQKERDERLQREAAEAERQRIAHEAEQKRLADEARAADIEYRRTINNAAVASLVKSGIGEDCAKAVITAIAKGDVDYVKIEY